MARFLLLLAPEPLVAGGWSAAQVGARTARFVAWVEELRARGTLREGAHLDPRGGRLLRDPDGGGELGVAAPVAHYFVIDACSWDEALALAARCPGAEPGAIDVYRLDEDASIGSALVSA